MSSRIFIVEDYAHLRQMLTEILAAAEGLQVCGSSGSGEEALTELQKTQADLVVVDVSLPGMNGFELVEALRTRTPDVLCVMLSGHSSNQYVRRAQAAGAKAFLEKTKSDQLAVTLHRVLRGESLFDAP